ncbi:IS110 family transposase [Leptolyngbya ohadii]|uniref:IS110 family transposase n=1 Tax=Leptolyngbya ohadii TaxID=1962290 RepID=UPI000B59B143|nr:transposase [Leptolyngbya ohadii]
MPQCWIGIDVSKKRLDVYIRPASIAFSYANRPDEIAQLVERIKAESPELVVLEATGGLHLSAATAIESAGIAVAVVNPRQVRDFAKAAGKLAKTDAIDAQVLAYFAEVMQPPVRPLLNEQMQQLKDLVARRHQLVEMMTAEKNRLSGMSQVVKENIEENIKWLQKRIKQVEQKVEELVEQNERHRRKRTVYHFAPLARFAARLRSTAPFGRCVLKTQQAAGNQTRRD